MSNSLRPHGLQHVRLPCPLPTPGACSNSCPPSQWCHTTVWFYVFPFSPVLSLSQHQGLFPWVSSLHQVAKVLEFQFQHQSFQRIFRTDFHLLAVQGRWQATPVLLSAESHGWRTLVGCSPWGREESDTTEQIHFHFSLSCIGEGNGNPLQCSCLENPRNGGAWWAAISVVTQSRTWLKRLSSSSSSPRDSQESAPKPQFESINSLILSFLHGPTLATTHDYWKNHSFA